MATFAAPIANTGARFDVRSEDRDDAGYRLMRHADPMAVGTNVFIVDNATVTTTAPDGTVVTWADVTHVFWGGHEAETITAAEATLLTAAGYTVT